jgi:hypothetical protein
VSVCFSIECIARMINVFLHFFGKMAPTKGFKRAQRESLSHTSSKLSWIDTYAHCYLPCCGMKMEVYGRFGQPRSGQEAQKPGR